MVVYRERNMITFEFHKGFVVVVESTLVFFHAEVFFSDFRRLAVGCSEGGGRHVCVGLGFASRRRL